MSNFWVKPNFLIRKIFSNYIWKIPNEDNRVFLTFDDGPTPEITEWVLEQLKIYNAKATFFCVGENIKKHPEILNTVISEGHRIGNHTFEHINGWKTPTNNYIENTDRCFSEYNSFLQNTGLTKLFRPPYGKMTKSQSRILRRKGYKIIMWDVLSRDYDLKVSPEQCLQNVLKNVNSGSIILFHDSVKAHQNLKYALPITLDYLSKNGYICSIIE